MPKLIAQDRRLLLMMHAELRLHPFSLVARGAEMRRHDVGRTLRNTLSTRASKDSTGRKSKHRYGHLVRLFQKQVLYVHGRLLCRYGSI